MALIIQHGELAHALADVQVCDVKKSHGVSRCEQGGCHRLVIVRLYADIKDAPYGTSHKVIRHQHHLGMVAPRTIATHI